MNASPEALGKKYSQQWNTAPVGLLRFGGMPRQTPERLRYWRTVRLIQAISATEHAIEADSAKVCDEILFASIGTADGKRRSDLVALRRRLFNRALPKTRELLVLSSLQDRTHRRLVARQVWRIRHLERLHRRAAEAFDLDARESRNMLRALLADEGFSRAIAVTNPALGASLFKQSNSGGGGQQLAEHQPRLKVQKYLARASVKTSPLSFLGPIAVATLDTSASSALHIEAASAVNTVFNNQLFEQQLLSLVCEIPWLREHLPYIANPSASIEGEYIVFMRFRSVAGVRRLENLSRCPADSTLVSIMAALRGSGCNDPMSALAQCDDLRKFSTAELQTKLDQLLAAGLVNRYLPLPGNARNRLPEIIRFIESIDDFRCGELVALLQQIDDALNGLAGADASTRIALLTSINGLVTGIADRHGLDTPRLTDICSYEDVHFQGMQARIGCNVTEAIGEELPLYLECLIARDRELGTNRRFVDDFKQRYGSGGTSLSLLQCAVRFSGMQAQLMARPLAERMDDPGFAKALQSRMRFAGFFDRLRHAHAGLEEVRIDPVELEKFCASIAPRESPRQSIGVHLQLIGSSKSDIEAGSFDLVVNGVLDGYGRYINRYSEAVESSGVAKQLARDLLNRDTQPDTAPTVRAHLLSIAQHSGQCFPYVFDREIVPPDEISALEPSRQITYSDLALSHDPIHDKLYLHMREDKNARVVPTLLGSLHRNSLAPLHLLLAHLSDRGLCPEGSRPDSLRIYNAPETEVLHSPRLRLGRLILERRSWWVPRALFPVLGKSTGMDFASFLALNRFASSHGLPQRAFIRSTSINGVVLGQHKPLYIDFGNADLLSVLRQEMAKETTVGIVFEEVLPDHSHFHFEVNAVPTVMELHLELSRSEVIG